MLRLASPTCRRWPRSLPALWIPKCCLTTASQETITVLDELYPTDDYTNLPPTLLPLLSRRLHLTPRHPLHTLRQLIAAQFPSFRTYDTLPALVTPELNFDSLGFPPDHPGRARGQSYYVNRGLMLRTHTSAHEVDCFRDTERGGGWLVTADVYRRDEIDRSHYPAFHQCEGARVVKVEDMLALEDENERLRTLIRESSIVLEDCPDYDDASNPLQPTHSPETVLPVCQNLKLSLTALLLSLFPRGTPIIARWTPDIFPWTSPSFQLEVRYRDAWLELLGCGIVVDSTLARAGHDPSGVRTWAFGIGLERVAMPLFGVPDIRLFWSEDERFWGQFMEGKVTQFHEFSKFPGSERDISFYLPPGVGRPISAGKAAGGSEAGMAWEENDLWDIIREVGGDMVESVKLVDDFWHEKMGRRSLTLRVGYRSMERSLTRTEVSSVNQKIQNVLVEKLRVEIRGGAK